MKIKLYILAIAGMLVLTACETTETPEPPIGPKYEKEILDNSDMEMSNPKSPKPGCTFLKRGHRNEAPDANCQ
ncbi:MAG: hypothetical protein HRU28_02040 [Rhizobiales bacterium]|nr:hypothetical protein [Hyphomicrobiales bacterium]